MEIRRSTAELHRFAVARVEQFSDGVFSIAITILVLQIAVPAVGGSSLLADLLKLWPSYLAYVISFLTIGGFWLGHHTIFSCIENVNARIIRVNLLLLMAIAFLPFPTAVMAQGLVDAGPGARTAVLFYGLSLLICRLLLSLLWRVCSKDNLLRPQIDRADLAKATRRLNPGVALYVVAIVVAVLLPDAGPWLYLAISIYTVVVSRSVEFASASQPSAAV